MASDLNAPRIREWIAWTKAASKTNPEYLPKALLAVLLNDGPRVLAAVLSELKMRESHLLIEAMRDPGAEGGAQKNDVSVSSEDKDGGQTQGASTVEQG